MGFYKLKSMNRRFIFSLVVALAALCSCDNVLGSETGSETGKPDVETDSRVVNGTKILEGHNLYGLICDTDGHPLGNVPVSDGYRYVLTDENGVYQTKADTRATHVFYSLPAGYAIEQDKSSGLPAFYRKIDPSASDIRNDFKLKKLSASSSAFSFAVLGDIHIRDAATAAQFKGGAMARIGQYFKDNAPAGPAFGISLGFLITNLCIKVFIARPRPYIDQNSLFYRFWLLVGQNTESDKSFPSGHMTAACATMTPLFILGNRRVKAASLIFALLMGLARIYLVVHYPSDVVAGLIVGVFAGSVAVLIAQKLPRKWYQWDILEKKKAA